MRDRRRQRTVEDARELLPEEARLHVPHHLCWSARGVRHRLLHWLLREELAQPCEDHQVAEDHQGCLEDGSQACCGCRQEAHEGYHLSEPRCVC